MDYEQIESNVLNVLNGNEDEEFIPSCLGCMFIALNTISEDDAKFSDLELKFARIIYEIVDITTFNDDYINKPYDIRMFNGGIAVYYIGEKTDVASFLINDSIMINTYLKLLNANLRRKNKNELDYKISLSFDEADIINIPSIDSDVFSCLVEEEVDSISKYQSMDDLDPIAIDECLYEFAKNIDYKGIKLAEVCEVNEVKNENDELIKRFYLMDIVMDTINDYVDGIKTENDDLFRSYEEIINEILNDKSELKTYESFDQAEDLIVGLKGELAMINVEFAFIDDFHENKEKSRVLKAFYENICQNIIDLDIKFINIVPHGRSLSIALLPFVDGAYLDYFNVACSINAVCSLINNCLDKLNLKVVVYSIAYVKDDTAFCAIPKTNEDYLIPYIPDFLYSKAHYYGLTTLFNKDVKPIVLDSAIGEFIISQDDFYEKIFDLHHDENTEEDYYAAYFFPDDFDIDKFAY